jgi:hypothetical protein
VCDLYGSSERPKNVQVCTEIDVEEILELNIRRSEKIDSQSTYGLPTKGERHLLSKKWKLKWKFTKYTSREVH